MPIEPDLKVHSYAISELKEAISNLRIDINHLKDKIIFFEGRLNMHDTIIEGMNKNINRIVSNQSESTKILDDLRIKIYAMRDEIKRLSSMSVLIRELFDRPKTWAAIGSIMGGMILIFDWKPILSYCASFWGIAK